MKKNIQKNKSTDGASSKKKNKLAIGIVATAAAVGAATGAYYFYGSKEAKKHREKFSVWFDKARDEVMTEAKKLKDAALNKQSYGEIVKTVSKRYQDLKKFDSNDVLNFIKVVGAEWKNLGTKQKNRVRRTVRSISSSPNSNNKEEKEN